MKYTREQLNGQIFQQYNNKYIIEYLDGDNLQFYREETPDNKLKGFTTEWINNVISVVAVNKIIFIKPLEPNYEIY